MMRVQRGKAPQLHGAADVTPETIQRMDWPPAR